MGYYKCTPRCGKSYDKEASLTYHQNRCKTHKAEQSKIRVRMRANVLANRQLAAERLHNSEGASEVQATSGVPPAHGAPSNTEVVDAELRMEVDAPPGGPSTARAAEPTSDTSAPAAAPAAPSAARGRPRRVRPCVDALPEGPGGIDEDQDAGDGMDGAGSAQASEAGQSWLARVRLRVRGTIRTTANVFGLYREYQEVPARVPDENVDIIDLSEESTAPSDPHNSRQAPALSKSPAPKLVESGTFPNHSTLNFLHWFWNCGPTKSLGDRDRLVNDVFHAPEGFDPEDINLTQLRHLDAQLAGAETDSNPFHSSDGWAESTVRIAVPDGIAHPGGAKDAPQFEVPHYYHRSLTEIIKTAFATPAAARFHFTPYKQMWRPPDSDQQPQRIVDEMYSTDAFLHAHEDVTRAPPEPAWDEEKQCAIPDKTCTLPRAVAGLMFASDSLQLTSFGDASLWPAYVQFANQSKRERSSPKARASHHVAYFPKLPDNLQDLMATLPNLSAKPQVITHCKRELMQACWELLLDADFMHAYVHGIVVKCADGVTRRLYPRIFTYSADYPEKILLCSIRDLGTCPCPRCLVPMARVPEMGTKRDATRRSKLIRRDDEQKRGKVRLARKFIYEQGRNVNSEAVERVLKDDSLVPTRNAFSDFCVQLPAPRNLPPPDPRFFLFLMLVVDFMHEWELGVWKGLLIHLLRLVTAQGASAVNTLDQRFRQTPPFGRDTIRRFSSNVSGLKRLAARDFEDILLCSIPAFEGLLPSPHNEIILTLIFTACWFHALAKLKMHSESTLSCLTAVTTAFGKGMRSFKTQTCDQLPTVELDREVASRARRLARSNPAAPRAAGPKKPKQFNLSTYKYHSLGDYVSTIQWFGPTDSYSTQISEREHRTSKASYPRTSKVNPAKQLAAIERRQSGLQNARAPPTPNAPLPRRRPNMPNVTHGERLPWSNPEAHHNIALSQKNPVHLGSWLSQNRDDPALQDFLPSLKDHLLGRLLKVPFDGEEQFTPSERANVIFKDHKIYSHRVLRINYTTYDVRRAQDSVKPMSARCHIMMLAHDDQTQRDSHPYWYAEVLGIFHAWVVHSGSQSRSLKPQKMEFLWVRWFGREPGHRSGWKALRLDRVGFVGVQENSPSFGFLDPVHIIRGAHLIPAFAYGRTSIFLGPSMIRPEGDDEDWESFYVNRFVDRDMFMRYLGGGVGHVGQTASQIHWARSDLSNRDDDADDDPLVDAPERGPDDTVPQPNSDEELDELSEEELDLDEETDIDS